MRILFCVVLAAASACVSNAPCPGAQSASPDTAGGAQSAPVAAEVRSAESAEVREASHGKARVTLLAQGANAFVGRLELVAGAAVPEHQDPTEEYIHVLSGSGVLTMDGVQYEVSEGATIFMPAGARVSFQNGDAPLVALQVFAGPEPAAKYQSWAPAE